MIDHFKALQSQLILFKLWASAICTRLSAEVLWVTDWLRVSHLIFLQFIELRLNLLDAEICIETILIILFSFLSLVAPKRGKLSFFWNSFLCDLDASTMAV